jgi:pimeloyl-ACP methyl ester carboxylesterase
VERLAEIAAPTLVIAGECAPFYSAELFRATAASIPNARLIHYLSMGHPATGKQFARDVLAFLRE